MKNYFFSGVIHPRNTDWNSGDVYNLEFVADGCLCLASIFIWYSQITATVETANPNISSVALGLEKELASFIDAHDFLGCNFSFVWIASGSDESNNHSVFRNYNSHLEGERTKHLLSFKDVYPLATKCKFLRRALFFFKLAKQSPSEDAANFCWLAITNLISFWNTNHKTSFSSAKNKLQKHLRIDKNLLDTLENLGSSSQLNFGFSKLLVHTSRIIDRFLFYAHIGYKPLSAAEFPLLVEEELANCQNTNQSAS